MLIQPLLNRCALVLMVGALSLAARCFTSSVTQMAWLLRRHCLAHLKDARHCSLAFGSLLFRYAEGAACPLHCLRLHRRFRHNNNECIFIAVVVVIVNIAHAKLSGKPHLLDTLRKPLTGETEGMRQRGLPLLITQKTQEDKYLCTWVHWRCQPACLRVHVVL